MTTIFEAAAGANRLNETLARAYQPQSAAFGQIAASLAKMQQAQFAGLGASLARAYQPQSAAFGQIAASLAKIQQAQFAGLGASLARAYQPQFSILNQTVAKSFQPLLDAVLALEDFDYDLLNTDSAPVESGRSPQGLSDREIAAMLTATAFLFIYITFSLLIKHSPQAAKLSATAGPTPFEAAMAVGAFVFWLWMNRSRR